MGMLLFDFDSTLVPCESLERVLARREPTDEQLARIAELTRAGMAGEITFAESLRARLEIARPTEDDVRAVGTELAAETTAGAAALVAEVHGRGHDVGIVSGGFAGVIAPVAAALGVPPQAVLAVRVRWADDGSFDGLVPNGFDESKAVGLSRLIAKRGTEGLRPDPVVVVGDGATDADLRDEGLADVFVAYVEHATRPAVVERADHVAADCAALGVVLRELLP